MIVKFIEHCTPKEIATAAISLKNGQLVVFPTETVYGLGADANNEEAIRRIYEVKGRPKNHPLIVHISSINQLAKWTISIPAYAMKLAEKFWPGPMTLILNRSKLAVNFVTGDQETVGLRIPSHPIALELLKQFESIGGNGVAAPSANKFGYVSPTSAQDVVKEIGSKLDRFDLVLEGGKSLIGIESTIIDCTGLRPRILRSGSTTKKMIELVCGTGLSKNTGRSKIRASGLLKSHYAPKAKVILDSIAKNGDGLIALAHIPTPNGAIRLSTPNTITDFARNFYSALREGDEKKLSRIVICLPEGDGLAEAIRERAMKAAAK